MAEGGKILSDILGSLREMVKPGATTGEIDDMARRLMKDHGVTPAFLGYNNFPAALCISINEEVVHGLPSAREIKEGDIVSVDAGLIYKGFNLDSAFTVIAGEAKEDSHKKLLSVCRQALEIGVSKARPGNTIGDIGSAIEDFVYSQGFMVIQDLVGHGVGRSLHEDPEVPNFGEAGKGEKLVPGLVIAIEPMVSQVSKQTKLSPDGFAYVAKRGDMVAHFEKTIAITEDGNLILTPTK